MQSPAVTSVQIFFVFFDDYARCVLLILIYL